MIVVIDLSQRANVVCNDLNFTGSFGFALAFQLTHLGFASGIKRLKTTPIFSGPTSGRHY